MNWNVGVFVFVLLLTPVLGIWCAAGYMGTSAAYSDLLELGIEYDSEAWTRIVETSKRQMRFMAVPLVIAYLIALCGWGIALRKRSRDEPH